MNTEFSEYQPLDSMPLDFPRATERGAVGGAATKFIAREIEGKFLVGDTQEETCERYLACCSLVSDLISYCKRKQRQDVSLSEGFLQRRVIEGLQATPQLELTAGEHQWVMSQLIRCMGWRNAKDDYLS